MSIPVSETLINDNRHAPIPLHLTSEQKKWVRHRAQALGVSEGQVIRSILNQWIRTERMQRRRSSPADRSPSERSAPTDPSAPTASPSRSRTIAPKRSGDTTLIHMLRQSMKTVERLHRTEAHGAHAEDEASDPDATEDRSPDSLSALRASASGPAAPSLEPSATDAPTGGGLHPDEAIRLLLEVARRAEVK